MIESTTKKLSQLNAFWYRKAYDFTERPVGKRPLGTNAAPAKKQILATLDQALYPAQEPEQKLLSLLGTYKLLRDEFLTADEKYRPPTTRTELADLEREIESIAIAIGNKGEGKELAQQLTEKGCGYSWLVRALNGPAAKQDKEALS